MATNRSAPKISRLAPFVLDGGNAWVKYVTGECEGLFPHAIAPIGKSQYDSGLERFGKSRPMDYLMVDGQHYAVGESAYQYETASRVKRAKYTRDYYGVLFAASIARAYASVPTELNGQYVRVMGSHASADYKFAGNVRDAVKGRWNFTCGQVKFNFEVTSVDTYEEPFGSYAKLAFVRHGRGWKTPLHGESVGIIDAGGGTCGVLWIEADGTPRQNNAQSGELGVNNARATLAALLEDRYNERFDKAKPKVERLEEALRTGGYRGFGTVLPCQEEVDIALAPLINDISNLYIQHLGAGSSLDLIILTGGGMALIAERVARAIGFDNITLADTPQNIQFANVRGAKMFDEVLAVAL